MFMSHYATEVCKCPQIFGGDAQAVGIIGHFPVLAVRSFLQHLKETAHNGSVLRGDVAFAIDAGMEIEKVEDGRLHSINQYLAVEPVLCVFDA